MSKPTTLIHLNKHTLSEITNYMDDQDYAPATRTGVLTSKAFELEKQLAEAQAELGKVTLDLNIERATCKHLKAELAKHQSSEFHPDWSLLKAAQDSIKEYQDVIGEKEQQLAEKDARIKELEAYADDLNYRLESR